MKRNPWTDMRPMEDCPLCAVSFGTWLDLWRALVASVETRRCGWEGRHLPDGTRSPW
jgi:hypothetical protein